MTDTHPDAGTRVLVVDDAPATRYIVASWLRREGYQVVEAATGGEALQLVAEQPLDVVVLDVGLPDMTGFEVCEKIKTTPNLRLPVVHLSATSVAGRDRAHGLDRGADAYLTDPVEPSELIATVRSVLRYYQARADAEELARQLAVLSRTTIAMNGAEDLATLLAAAATGAAEVAGASATVVAVAPDHHLTRAAVAAPQEPPVLSSAPPGLLAALRVHLDGRRDPRPLRPVPLALLTGRDGDETGTAWTVVARSRSGQPPVCVAVHGGADPPGSSLADVLVQLGNAAVLAVDAQRLHSEEHNLALTLQRSFLPDTFPPVPGFQPAVRYLPAMSNAEIGGDFYEIVEIGDGRVLVAVGDVAGHSIHAATIMVELRHALRAYALDSAGPAGVLNRLERMLRHYHRREYATLCLMVLDTAAGRLDVACAGHPPPLLVAADGATYAEAAGPMLGLGLEHRQEVSLPLAPVETIVLYTDGLVEDRPADIDAALERLRTWPGLRADADDLCDDLLAHFGRTRSDDIAVLVLRRADTPV